MRTLTLLLATALLACACRSGLPRVSAVEPLAPDEFRVVAESDRSTDEARSLAAGAAARFAAERGRSAVSVGSSQVVYLLDLDGPGGASPGFAYRLELVFRLGPEEEDGEELEPPRSPDPGEPPSTR